MDRAADYSPLDLSAFHNAGTSRLPRLRDSSAAEFLGTGMMRGLPFMAGSDQANCYLALGGSTLEQQISLPIGESPMTLIVAHLLADPWPGPGEATVAPVAMYVFVFSDGEVLEVPIRRRVEIDSRRAPMPAGAQPDRYAAVPNVELDAFTRRTEVARFEPRAWLWAWRNPRPELRLDTLRIEALEETIVIVGITLGFLDEEPLRPFAAQPVTLETREAQDAARQGPFAIHVDRGTVSSMRQLVRIDQGDYALVPGSGTPHRDDSRTLYAMVSAIPSATLRIDTGHPTAGAVRFSDLLMNRAVALDGATIAMAETGRNWVRTEFLDEQSGAPLACRVTFRSPTGITYLPYGHGNAAERTRGGDLQLGATRYAYVDGQCEGWLPRGQVTVEVARGFEYEPVRLTTTIGEGQRHLRVALRRWVDMAASGWFSGDTHAHGLSTQAALLEARAEDLRVVNVLMSQWGELFTNTDDFVGGAVASADGTTVVYVAQENRQHFLGHLGLLGLRRPVLPWCSDGADEAELGGPLAATLSEQADECHSHGGTVVLAHFPRPWGETAALVASGRADAVEWIGYSRVGHEEYYRYLNAGYRLPLVAGTDKLGSDVQLGIYRTYVQIADEPFSYEGWRKNLAAGRTFMSGGPIVWFSVDGQSPGAVIRLPSRGGRLHVAATARSFEPVHSLEIVMGGRVVAASQDPAGRRELSLDETVTVDEPTWLAARVNGPGGVEPRRHLGSADGAALNAHTSPIYVECGEARRPADPEARAHLRALVQAGLHYVRTQRTLDPAGRQHRHTEPDHQAHLERPFLEGLSRLG